MGVTVSQMACLTLIGALATAAVASAPAASNNTVYVAPSGHDNAPGTSSAPVRTIAAALARTPSDGTVIVRSGSYHETLTMQGRSGRTLEAAPGATVWLDGSRVVGSWARQGSTWVASGWTSEFDSSPTFSKGGVDGTAAGWTFVNPARPMAAHPDQVWIDGVAQRQVGSRSAVRAGSFFVDYSAHQLVIGTNPASHTVRASDLAKAISIRDPDTTISGINVRRYATSVPMMGTVTVERPGARLTYMRVEQNAVTGLFVGGADARLSQITLDRNGMLGMHANRADGITLDRVTSSRNNTQGFNQAPSAGGIKISRTRDVTVRDSSFRGNDGTGLWLDESVYNFQIYGSRFVRNKSHGMALEISGAGKVADNLITGNIGDGIKINDTDHVSVWNNSIIGNTRAVNIVQDARDVSNGQSYRDPSLPLSLRSEYVTVRNNILAQPHGSATCLLCVEDYTYRFSAEDLHISADANVYRRTSPSNPHWLVVWSHGKGNPAVFTSLEAMRSNTGQERHGQLFTTPVLKDDDSPSATVTKLAPTLAYGAPGWVASAAGVSEGRKRLGSWTR